MPHQKIAVIVLAGGQSSRMGTDKALLEIEGKSLLQRACEVAAALTPQVYVLTAWPDRYRSTLTEPSQFLVEYNPGTGPLVALTQGLTDISADWILLLACDLPLLDSRIIDNWASKLTEFPPSTLAVVPYQNSRWEPLCGFYRPQSLSSLQSFIEKGGRSFQKWLNQIQAIPLPVGKPEALMLSNCNTLEEFHQLKGKIVNG
ncbi:MAG: molybdenum cofactor guanylyltransferase [Microcoleus sp. PH2017_10_PVI_O_A]|uniref:molybdenum cofactor guanylyltransferase n=1 Tax=unclassified Microcoleus TaxID=2642155 RepID=UPI001DD0BA0F|nr:MULTISPECIES: molybdenum cofactor guanylyltransferase [unclassified Microcoleus]TAE75570.1 MAG: molybdenum cofactor guanylyltransferase [Oscillatoriales cyanobacterium]MCC3409467.1 molybdenum cofactor guanylyltransferase [Microcoleus sp. PH2017_10_PVI_O_A]MCC3463696.1 molybdenum cofactor guanylyltransferase [Microcoleus sp. PH2017_11_PCY_U_A]MCC3482083.1 molybdenum cofactor guanylyltransferase [Microcoleus sp. PH2017_12_PCY_D_A]MCC3532015.1 molybdenum cofactor guanylyltransferase [Microcole